MFWGGREGYQSLLNTDLNAELSHMANFFKMAVSKYEKGCVLRICGRLLVLNVWLFHLMSHFTIFRSVVKYVCIAWINWPKKEEEKTDSKPSCNIMAELRKYNTGQEFVSPNVLEYFGIICYILEYSELLFR